MKSSAFPEKILAFSSPSRKPACDCTHHRTQFIESHLVSNSGPSKTRPRYRHLKVQSGTRNIVVVYGIYQHHPVHRHRQKSGWWDAQHKSVFLSEIKMGPSRIRASAPSA
jgi:hypothetical protein